MVNRRKMLQAMATGVDHVTAMPPLRAFADQSTRGWRLPLQFRVHLVLYLLPQRRTFVNARLQCHTFHPRVTTLTSHPCSAQGSLQRPDGFRHYAARNRPGT